MIYRISATASSGLLILLGLETKSLLTNSIIPNYHSLINLFDSR